ncbi:MAG: laccase domain-containing protein [Zetaproteobacteria bacterium]|nr:MAG: laccase domain-containing protein [Zetaproteobacteria bacterium]
MIPALNGVAQAGFTTRAAGDFSERDASAWERLADEAGVSVPHRARQVHGVAVRVCAGEGRLHEAPADALIGVDGAAVAVRTADCVPVLLAAPAHGIVAAAHAGWRGLAQGVLPVLLAALKRLGVAADALHAAVGPAIGPCCFTVAPTLAERLAARGAPVIGGTPPRVDLRRWAVQMLMRAGVEEARVELAGGCTACEGARFFSWRARRERERMAAVVGLR